MTSHLLTTYDIIELLLIGYALGYWAHVLRMWLLRRKR